MAKRSKNEDVAIYIASLEINGNNLRGTARELDIDFQKLKYWRDKYRNDPEFAQEIAPLVKQFKDDAGMDTMYIIKARRLLHQSLDQVEKSLKNASAKQASDIAKDLWTQIRDHEHGEKAVKHVHTIDMKSFDEAYKKWQNGLAEAQEQRAKQLDALNADPSGEELKKLLPPDDDQDDEKIVDAEIVS
jgi:hypothetical protein